MGIVRVFKGLVSVQSYPASVRYCGQAVDTTSSLTYTFSAGLDLGPVNFPDAVAVVALHQIGGAAGKLITNLQINGRDVPQSQITQGQRHSQSYGLLVPGTGQPTVTVTYDGSPTRCAIGLWYLIGYQPLPTDIQSVFSGVDTSRALNMTIPYGGACVLSGTESAGTVVTTTNATEDYDVTSTNEFVGARTTTTGAVTVTFNAVSSMVGMAFARTGT